MEKARRRKSTAVRDHPLHTLSQTGDQGQALEPARETILVPAAGRLIDHRQRPPRALYARLSRISLARAFDEERDYGHAFLFIPVFIGTGALVWFSRPESPSFAALALLLCALGTAAFFLRHARGVWPGLVRAAALVVLGMLLAALETARLQTVLLDSPVTTFVRGTVTGRETTDQGHWRYIVTLTSTSDPHLARAPAVVTLLSRSREAPVPIGDVIEGRARLSPPSGPALSGLNDFAFDSYFKGIGAVGYFYGAPHAVPDLPDADGLSVHGLTSLVLQTIARWREAIGDRIRAAIGGDAGAIAAALVTGEERAISPQTVNALRDAGLAHVLAISGLNMVLAAGTLLVGARTVLSLIPGLAHRLAIKKVAAAGALVMVFLYILIAGGAVSAMRSWIMISVMLVAVFFDRPSISLRNVALSAIVILVTTPSAVTGPGFQMSFAATLALVAGYAVWRERPQRAQGGNAGLAGITAAAGSFVGGLLLSSFIGGISTLVYSAGHFHRLTAYGLLGNVLAMPVISVMVMPFALIAMLLMPFGLDQLPLLVMGQGLEWMMAIAMRVSSLGGQVTTGRMPEIAFVLIATGGMLACLFRTWLAVSGLCVVVIGVAAAVAFSVPRPDLVISEDGRLVALIGQDLAATNRDRPPDFIFSQWQRALRLSGQAKPLLRSDLVVADDPSADVIAVTPAEGSRMRKPPVDKAAARLSLTRLFAETPEGRFACVPKQWCAARAHGWKIVAVEDARLIGAACDGGDIIATPAMLRFSTCRSGATLVTGQSLRRTGALEIFATGPNDAAGPSGQRIVAAVSQTHRPWDIHRTYDWRTGQFDPTPTAD